MEEFVCVCIGGVMGIVVDDFIMDLIFVVIYYGVWDGVKKDV